MDGEELEAWLIKESQSSEPMSDTRPGELSRLEAKKLAEEMAAVIGLAADERKYREHVLTTLARMEVKVDNLKEMFDSHATEDDMRFGNVNQKIGDNSASISKGVGIAAAIVAMMGLMMWIIQQVQK